MHEQNFSRFNLKSLRTGDHEESKTKREKVGKKAIKIEIIDTEKLNITNSLIKN